MAFSVSYGDSVSKNIKHMYRTRDPTREAKRQPPIYKKPPDPLGPSPRARYPRRFFDFYPDLGIGLPRAPAFRVVPKAAVDAIIARVSKPTLSRTDTIHKLCGSCQSSVSKKAESRRYGYQKVSPSEVGSIVSRLSQPSKSPRPYAVSVREQDDGMPPVVA